MSGASRVPSNGGRTVRVAEVPGRVPYRRALAAQRRLARAKIDGREPHDWLLLLEHRPVLTLGRGARDGRHVTAAPEALARRGIETVEIERGGDVTYHGPGQLVGYPILDLRRWRRDLHWYVRTLEAAVIGAAGRLGVRAFRVAGATGVWVGEDPGHAAAGDRAGEGSERAADAEAWIRSGRVRKLASIGVHVSRWVTWHGFALNVTEAPLENFRLIVPCGLPDVRMTSLSGEGAALSSAGAADAALRRAVREGFSEAFETEVEVASVPPAGFGRGPAPVSGRAPMRTTPGAQGARGSRMPAGG